MIVMQFCRLGAQDSYSAETVAQRGPFLGEECQRSSISSLSATQTPLSFMRAPASLGLTGIAPALHSQLAMYFLSLVHWSAPDPDR